MELKKKKKKKTNQEYAQPILRPDVTAQEYTAYQYQYYWFDPIFFQWPKRYFYYHKYSNGFPKHNFIQTT